MARNVIPVDPDKFPWLDLRRYTFSLGTEKDGVVYVSGHTASSYNEEKRRVLCEGDIVEQSKVAWEKIGVVLEAAGMTYDNIVRTTDYIAPPGLGKFRGTAAVREEYMGKSPVASTGVLVHSLLRPDALIEINAIAVKGKKEAIIPPGPEFERFKDLTYAPAVKVDNKVWLTGVITLEPNDTVGQAEWVLRPHGDDPVCGRRLIRRRGQHDELRGPAGYRHLSRGEEAARAALRRRLPRFQQRALPPHALPPRAPRNRSHRDHRRRPRADRAVGLGGFLA